MNILCHQERNAFYRYSELSQHSFSTFFHFLKQSSKTPFLVNIKTELGEHNGHLAQLNAKSGRLAKQTRLKIHKLNQAIRHKEQH